MRKMKDSGIEWIGDIPENWNVGKTLFALSMPITDGPHETPELLEEGIPFVSAEAVSCGNGKIDFEHIRGFISQEYYEECCKKYTPQINDIYMIKSGATTGKVALVDTDEIFTIWSPLAVFRCDDKKCFYKYLFYVLQSDYYQKQVENKWSFGTQQNIGMRTLEKLLICYPPVKEQVKIANYLDNKCVEIDALIEAKEKTNSLLKEQRQSIIYEAVTKGLNPDVPMKDSGIEWIGEIPESWKISRFRSEFSFGKGLSITKADLTEDGIGVVSYGQIHSKVNIGTSVKKEMIKFVNEKYMDTNISSLTFTGDIIFADTSEDLLGCGNCVYVDTDEPIFAGYHTIISRPKERKNAKYYAYLFATDAWRSQIRAKASGVKLFSITQAMLRDALIILPNEIDMSKIVTFLDDKCSQIDTLIESNITTIEKLKEYRKSIIFEAVTGKVEV